MWYVFLFMSSVLCMYVSFSFIIFSIFPEFLKEIGRCLWNWDYCGKVQMSSKETRLVSIEGHTKYIFLDMMLLFLADGPRIHIIYNIPYPCFSKYRTDG